MRLFSELLRINVLFGEGVLYNVILLGETFEG